MSRTIKELEEDLGEQLFVRSSRSTRLTRAGKLFLEHVPRVFTALEQARDSVKAAAASSLFFQTGNRSQTNPTATVASQPAVPDLGSTMAAFDALAGSPASTVAQPADSTAVQNRQDQKEAFLQSGSTETRNTGHL